MSLIQIHNSVFGAIRKVTEDWLLGLSARLIFSSVLLYYFWNSACTKVVDKCSEVSIYFNNILIPNSLIPNDGSYAQMLPPIAEHYSYDASSIPIFPWKIIVVFGTYAEFILPILLLLGLFTRLSALGMIGFIAVMTYVDISFHGVDAQTIGSFFDKVQTSAIADQRLLWLMPLILLVVKGPGLISLDQLFGSFFKK